MKERPILFNGAMVRAILSGQKTQTRRILKSNCTEIGERDDGTLWPWSEHPDSATDYWHPCPHGKPGDRLWVRETWSIDALGSFGTPAGYDSTYELSYKAGGDEREIHVNPGEPDPYIKFYDSQRGDWRPSIHMPRWASRITLEITSVRVERLRSITEADAEAEGCTAALDDGPTYRDEFSSLWRRINGAESWNANPWVWVIEFKRVTP